MASTATKMATGQMVDHKNYNHGQRTIHCDQIDINQERIKLDTIRLNDNYEVEELFIKEWPYYILYITLYDILYEISGGKVRAV